MSRFIRTTVCWSSGVGLRMWWKRLTPPVSFRKSLNMRSVSARTKLSRVTIAPATAAGAAFSAPASPAGREQAPSAAVSA